MLSDFEEELKAKFNDSNIHTDKYFGEIRDPQKVKIDINNLPLVLIDYIGDDNQSALKKRHSFSLYITHISYSNNKKTRTSKHYELYELLEKIDKLLNLQSYSESEPIRVNRTRKIADQVTDIGYLTVFKKDFTVIL